MFSDLTYRLRRLFRREGAEQELDEELRYHVDRYVDEQLQRGVSRSDAERQARITFGTLSAVKEECRDASGLRLVTDFAADVRYAVRGLRSRPFFAAAVIGFLTLAIGANTALFTFINAYVFKPLPIRAADRNADVAGYGPDERRHTHWSAEEFAALEGRASPVAELYAISRGSTVLTQADPRKIEVEYTSPNFLDLLGAPMMLGGPFHANAQPDPVIVLSFHGWQRHFASDGSVVNRRVRLGRDFFTVIGVTSPEFCGTNPFPPDGWIPLAFKKGDEGLEVAAIVHLGLNLQAAEAALAPAVFELNMSRPSDAQLAAIRLHARPAFSRADAADAVAVGMVAMAFVVFLLIACANLASLHLAGAFARQREIAIRLSIGASRARVIRQLLTESLVLAVLGALAAYLLTWWSVDALQRWLFIVFVRVGMNVQPVAPDWRVFLAGFGFAMAAAAAFGLLPAVEATRPRLSAVARSSRSRNTLIAFQVGASLCLLVFAGLLVRNAERYRSTPSGLPLQQLITVEGRDVSKPELIRRLLREPEVRSISAVQRAPMRGVMNRDTATIDGAATQIFYNHVDHRYFETTGIQVLRGRSFTAAEAASQARVAVISAATARTLWPNANPIGRVLPLTAGLFEVVGVANDVASSFVFTGLDRTLVYLPGAAELPVTETLLLRVDAVTPSVVRNLQRACMDVNPSELCEPQTLQFLAELQHMPIRMASEASIALSLLALALTAIGLNGVVGFSVTRRTREIGVRMALGATQGQVVRFVLSSSLKGVTWGVALGLPLCIAAAKVAGSVVYFVKFDDPAVLVGTPIFLFATVLLATVIPARRATRLGPATALRQD